MHRGQDNMKNHDEMPTEAKAETAQSFINQMRDGIALVRVELAAPVENLVREMDHSPDSRYTR
jgi:hypothetical protein